MVVVLAVVVEKEREKEKAGVSFFSNLAFDRFGGVSGSRRLNV